MVMPGGKYKGVLITRVPSGYLNYLTTCDHPLRPAAEAELKRRGWSSANVEITPHAINRASLRLGYQWAKHSREDEGLHTWLVRMSEEALAKVKGGSTEDLRVSHHGIVFVFETQYVTPVLKSVWLTKEEEDAVQK